ncbi:MAG: pseudouridine synthase [Candidatus Cohnella colombiensis]|uniref:Pseudouridine synthase n=1 Tax=Candidatus Cohnella colombiensis TaxID=3121368 RepID=A0AA95EXT9_9BACL|nr:MAG: pseudouridine synthase [Cohnella sp.]
MKSTIRLDKMLGNLGFGTRSEIKLFVRQGAVTVNGAKVKDPGLQVDPTNDDVNLHGERIQYRDTIYVMLHKPAGVVSATEDNRDRTVLDLLDREVTVFQPFPVGRLDKDTEGLLLLTNDGKLAHELLSPRKHVPKTYRALVAGDVDHVDRDTFAQGVKLDDGYVTMPAQLQRLDNVDELTAAIAHVHRVGGTTDYVTLSWVELTIHEGKFHQVKRMFEAVGKKVLYLRRVSMGPLKLDAALAPGQWRELTQEEIDSLHNQRKDERE